MKLKLPLILSHSLYKKEKKKETTGYTNVFILVP